METEGLKIPVGDAVAIIKSELDNWERTKYALMTRYEVQTLIHAAPEVLENIEKGIENCNVAIGALTKKMEALKPK